MADRSERDHPSSSPNSNASVAPDTSTTSRSISTGTGERKDPPSTSPFVTRPSPYDVSAIDLVGQTALSNRSFTAVQHPTSRILERHVFELQEALQDVNRFDSTGDKRERRQDPKVQRAEATQREISADLAVVLGKVGVKTYKTIGTRVNTRKFIPDRWRLLAVNAQPAL